MILRVRTPAIDHQDAYGRIKRVIRDTRVGKARRVYGITYPVQECCCGGRGSGRDENIRLKSI